MEKAEEYCTFQNNTTITCNNSQQLKTKPFGLSRAAINPKITCAVINKNTLVVILTFSGHFPMCGLLYSL